MMSLKFRIRGFQFIGILAAITELTAPTNSVQEVGGVSFNVGVEAVSKLPVILYPEVCAMSVDSQGCKFGLRAAFSKYEKPQVVCISFIL